MKQEGENFELEHIAEGDDDHIDEEMIDDVA
jgi:hypothetical protein